MGFVSLFLVLAGVVVIAGALARQRVRRTVEGKRPVVSDEVLRRILEEGAVSPEEEEPLDEDAARDAEDRFWDETWDEPEGEGWR
jgi:hypothetical protein